MRKRVIKQLNPERARFIKIVDRFNLGLVTREFMETQLREYSKIDANADKYYTYMTRVSDANFTPSTSGSMDIKGVRDGKKTPKRYAEGIFDGDNYRATKLDMND